MSNKQVNLFSPVQIGSLELGNRLVRSATAERLATEPIGRATPDLAALFQDLARGGVGLIISGHAYTTAKGKAHPEMLSVHCDEMIPGLRSLTDTVHDNAGLIALQINHGGRQCDEACTPETMAPSAVPASSDRLPREMTPADITEAVDAFGQAARRAQEAGFDAVQLHGAHGYLIGQFLSPHTNRRRDFWGGDFEGRLRFLAAVCEAVRGEVGPSYPVFIKLGMMDNLEAVPDGLTLEDGTRIVSRLADLKLDAVEVSGGYAGGSDFNVRLGVGAKVSEAYFRALAQRARAATHLPVILVGGLRTRVVMDEVLATGDADMISISRPLIREPDLPNRLRTGEATASACISGGRCWAKSVGQGIACKCEG